VDGFLATRIGPPIGQCWTKINFKHPERARGWVSLSEIDGLLQDGTIEKKKKTRDVGLPIVTSIHAFLQPKRRLDPSTLISRPRTCSF